MDAEAMKEHCILACSQWLAQSVFLSSRTCLPRVGTIHNELSPPTSIINVKKKCPTNMPRDQSDGGDSSIEGRSSQVLLVCIELTETNLHCYQY